MKGARNNKIDSWLIRFTILNMFYKSTLKLSTATIWLYKYTISPRLFTLLHNNSPDQAVQIHNKYHRIGGEK